MKPLAHRLLPLLASGLFLMLTSTQAIAQATKSRSTREVIKAEAPASMRKADTSSKPEPMPTGKQQNSSTSRTQISRESSASKLSTAPKKPATSTSNTAAKIYDRQGRSLTGYKQVGPNVVLDTRTGRYHNTTQMGDGQRLLN